MTTTLRSLLAILLLCGVYLLGIGAVLVLGVVLVLVALLALNWTGTNGPGEAAVGQGILLAAGTVPVLLAVVQGLTVMGRASRAHPESVGVVPAEAPELWGLIRDVATKIGTAPPAELRLTAAVNASVTEDARLLGLRSGRRCLYLGLPLLAELTVGELRALLGHELGHYAGRHTRMGTVIYRGHRALDTIQENLRTTLRSGRHVYSQGFTVLVFRCFAGYAKVYARLSFAVRRRQEIEADRIAAGIAGPRAMMGALRAVRALDPVWREFVGDYLAPTGRAGYLPDNPFAAFQVMIADEGRRKRLNEAKAAEPDDGPGSPFDSHPSLAVRLGALRAIVPDELPGGDADTQPAAPLRPDKPARFLADPLSFAARVRTVPVPDWLRHAAHTKAPAAPTRRLFDAADDLLGRPRGTATLGTVLDLLEAGDARRLAGRLTGAPTEEESAAHRALGQLCEALFAVVAHSLVTAGCGHWRICWAGPSDLVVTELGADGVHSTAGRAAGGMAELVFEAIDHPSNVERLRFRLITLHLNPNAPPADTPEPVAPTVIAADPRILAQARGDKRRAIWLAVGSIAAVTTVMLVGVAIRGGAPSSYQTLPYSNQLTTPYTPDTGLNPAFSYSNPYSNLALPTLGYHKPLPPISGQIVVKPGDTLAKIARCYGTTVADLRQLNNLGTATVLRAGQTLTVPDVILLPAGC